MSNQEILTKAIELAIAGGWNIKPTGIIVSPNTDLVRLAPMFIFNHDFAKSIWPKGHCDKQELLNFDDGSRHIEHYLYHLQMMVIAADPIKYLGENI